MKHLVMAAMITLAGCAQQSGPGNETSAMPSEAAPLSPGVAPVRVGEGGPGFPACGTRGTVINLSPGGVAQLSLRAAPLAEANEIARLGNGQSLFLCARSIDQKWQGVVVPPESAPDADCGVAAPIDAPTGYAGPCRSGWVATGFVRVGGAVTPP